MGVYLALDVFFTGLAAFKPLPNPRVGNFSQDGPFYSEEPDEHLLSPNNINALQRAQVMRIKKTVNLRNKGGK